MFEDRTTENLKKEVLEAIRPEAGVSTLAGSYADAVAGPLCQMVSNLYKALPAVTSMLFIDESSGRFIDLVAQDYHDLTRRAGTRARCTVTLTGKAGTAIPAGTVFLTGTGLQFLLLESVAIGSGGSAVGRLEAAEAGSAYNIASGTLSRMYVNINGLERYVNGQAEGGTDRESDAALYQRVDEARKQPATSGNGWDYRRWAMEADEWVRSRWWSCGTDLALWGSPWWTATLRGPPRKSWKPWRPTSRSSARPARTSLSQRPRRRRSESPPRWSSLAPLPGRSRRSWRAACADTSGS